MTFGAWRNGSAEGPTLVFQGTAARSDEVAFAHALKLALHGRGRLLVLQHAKSVRAQRHQVRAVLERWQQLMPASAPDDVATLGLRVEKLVFDAGDPWHACSRAVTHRRPDLVVAGIDGKLPDWSAVELLATLLRLGIPSVFLPEGAGGFVPPATGELQLANVVIIAQSETERAAALEGAAAMVRWLEWPRVTFTLIDVGPSDPPTWPKMKVPLARWQRWERSGPINEVAAAAASDVSAELIVTAFDDRSVVGMPGDNPILNLARAAQCAVLVIPILAHERKG